MKRIFAIVSLVVLFSAAAMAQGEKKDVNWKERIEAEKIAYLTAEMDLTAEEAQGFWPVYNNAKKVRDEVNEAVRDSYKALKEAIGSDASDKEISRLLREYLDASQMAATVSAQYVKDYEKVLPAKKVAKYYLVEEKFRKFQFNKLNNGAGQQRPEGRPAPGSQNNGKFQGRPQVDPSKM